MHLTFQASQIDVSRAGKSFIHVHPIIQSCTKMHLKRKKATSQKKELKVVYKRAKAVEKKIDEAKGEEATQFDQQQQCI